MKGSFTSSGDMKESFMTFGRPSSRDPAALSPASPGL